MTAKRIKKRVTQTKFSMKSKRKFVSLQARLPETRLHNFLTILESVNITPNTIKSNMLSMSDGKGGRIIY